MKISRIITGFIFLLFVLTVAPVKLRSQVPVETSKEKVIISGVPYFIHTVKKGQTSYSISKAYGIRVETLTAENPPALYGLKEGQVLRIPATATEPKPFGTEAPARVKDETRFSYHNLKAGETVYSLSRLYGVSDAEIIQSNPGIDINKLSVGTEIAIPKRDFITQKQKFNNQETKYIFHKVERGETLASIARKYNIPLRELRRENRNMRFPKVGDYIRVPSKGIPEVTPVQPAEVDTIPEIEEPVTKIERPSGFTEIKKLEGKINVAVLLPFYLRENSDRIEVDSTIVKGKKQYKYSRLPEDWIYPVSFDFVEMYNGILLAADTLRSLGMDISINAWDLREDTLTLVNLIKSGKLADMDLIIGPVYSRNLQILSDYAANLGIPVVSPVALKSNSVLKGHTNLFIANPSLEVAQRQLSARIAESNNSNLVFIHTDSLGVDPDVKRYREMIFGELTRKMPYEDIRFRELIFYPRSAFGNDSINRISHTLADNMENIIIIASEDPSVISETITIAHGLSKKFNVRVYGYPSMIYLDNLDPGIFFELNQLILSPYSVNYSSPAVRQFDLNYRKKFLTMPLEVSYAWIGHDIAYYFISGIAMHGKQLMEHPEMHRPALLQNDFEFERKSPEDGFENQKLFKIRYSKDYVLRTED